MKKLFLLAALAASLSACSPAMSPDEVRVATKACLDAGLYASVRNETSRMNGAVSAVVCKPFRTD